MANPRDVELNIVGRDNTSRATKSAADNLDKLRRALDGVDDANKKVGSRAGGHLRRLSDSLRDAANKMDGLKRKTEDGTLAVRSLGSQSAASLRRMSRGVDDAADEVARLKRKVDEVDRANQTLGQRAGGYYRRMMNAAAKAATDVRTAWTLGTIPLIAAAIAALPTAATIAGMGIVLGLGGAIAALGLISSKTKETHDALGRFKFDVLKDLEKISAAFRPVWLEIIEDMREAFASLRPELKKTFDRLAPIVEKFSGRLFKALDELEPALGPIVDGFETLADELGKGMPGLLEDIATAFTDISDAIGDNPEAIGEVITGLGDLIKTVGKVIAWLIRMNAHIDSSEAGFDTLMHGATASLGRIVTVTTDMVADVAEALARIPGFGAPAFRDLARSARAAADKAQEGLDKINTRKAQADLRAAEARLRVLGNMKPTPEVKAEIAELKRKIAEAKRLLGLLDGTTATVKVKYVQLGRPRGGKISGPAIGGGDQSAGGVGFALTAPGGTYRTGGPAMPDVYATTYVTLDGREIAAAVRTVISEATGRQSFRARSGRR